MTIYEKLKPYLKDYLRDMHGIQGKDLRSFRCLNPNHEDRHPSMSFDEKKNIVHCFSCGASYDIVSLAEQDFGSKAKAMDYLKKAYLSGNGTKTSKTADLSPSEQKSDCFIYPTDQKPVIDYLSDRRGFLNSKAIADRYHLTSDGKRIYFPHRLSDRLGGLDERGSWQSRAIDETDHNHRYERAKGSTASFYCPCLSLIEKTVSPKKLFVLLEGEMDFLSFEDLRESKDISNTIEVDTESKCAVSMFPVATSSVSNVTANKDGLFNLFLDGLNDGKTEYGFILAFDDDPSGREATKTAKAVLKNRGFKCCSKVFYCQGCKDLNESIIKDREATAKALMDIAHNFDEEAKKEESKTQAEYVKTHSARAEMDSLFSSLGEISVNPVRTHYRALDEALEGEITGGSVVTIGAMSSVGKTTFLLQMAEQIAIEEGRDILYFNLEQSARDLIAKSISRLTFIKDTKGKIAQEDSEMAKTAVGISQGRRYANYSQEEKDLIQDCKGIYSTYADSLYFLSPSADELGFSGRDIAQKTKEHIEMTGHYPVVMVDYLQIMKPISKGTSDKEAVEQNFLALKSMASRYGIVVFLLCSVNRSSYGGFVEMDSLKETGMIEYSTDYLLGINYEESREVRNKSQKGNGKTTNEDRENEKALKEAKGKPIANIVVNIIKNRNGKIGDEIKFKYLKLFNTFICNGMRSDLDSIFVDDTEKMAVIEDKDLPF